MVGRQMGGAAGEFITDRNLAPDMDALQRDVPRVRARKGELHAHGRPSHTHSFRFEEDSFASGSTASLKSSMSSRVGMPR